MTARRMYNLGVRRDELVVRLAERFPRLIVIEPKDLGRRAVSASGIVELIPVVPEAVPVEIGQ